MSPFKDPGSAAFIRSMALGKPLLGYVQEKHRETGLVLVSRHLHSKGSEREVPGRTRGRCGWVSAGTTGRARVACSGAPTLARRRVWAAAPDLVLPGPLGHTS